jgi:hypothetical protein
LDTYRGALGPHTDRVVTTASHDIAALTKKKKKKRATVVGFLGGLGLFVICYLPPVLLGIATGGDSLEWHSGGVWFDYGGALSAVPGFVAVALLAPFVGYRRRDWLMLLIPGQNFYVACLIGSRAAKLARSDGQAL